MKRITESVLSIVAVAAAVVLATSMALPDQPVKRHTIMFYNVENLFDTINDPNVNDEEFTPEGVKQWNGTKYWKKMANIERVLYTIASENKEYPDIIGLSEIENRNVLEDIVSTEKLQRANYQIVHYDSPERRGVDVAFLYRPDRFKLEGSEAVRTIIEGRPDFLTRDILTMWGTMEGEPMFLMVAHWPSRRGGESQSSYLREDVARQMRRMADSVSGANAAVKIVMMGDWNDDPSNKSIAEVLGGKLKIDEVKEGDYFNPFYQLHKDGYGSLAYADGWNLFDNIVVGANIAHPQKGTLGLWRGKKNKYWGYIFDRPFLHQQSGQYKGYPLRTYVGNNFQDGYSDHFPTYIYLSTEQ